MKVTTQSGLTVGQGLVFRSDATGANLFLLSRVSSTGEWSLRRRTGGTYSYLWQEGGSPTGAANDVAKVVLNGTSIKVYVNDVLRWSGNDSQGVGNTIEGVWASSTAVCNYDNFEHTDAIA